MASKMSKEIIQYAEETFKNKEILEVYKEYMDYRLQKKLPLTKRIIKMNHRELQKNAHHGIEELIQFMDLTMERGWKGLKWEYYANSKANKHDSGSGAFIR